MGMKVEARKIPIEELTSFEEAGACGTAAVISPIKSIVDIEMGITYSISEEPGKVCTMLYEKLRNIQYGNEPDTHGWVTVLE
jgi:branched-chain amino acid aminotransferase